MDEYKIGPGHIVLAELPHYDGSSKERPCLLLAPMRPFGDYLVCGISSKLRHYVGRFDEIILLDDSDFGTSGLQFPSLIRLGWLGIVSESAIDGSIGHISSNRFDRLLKALTEYLNSFLSARP